MMVSDYDKYSIRIECERAIREIPSVLILHRERPPVDFSGWKGIQADVGWSSDPSLLPMIGQSTTVTAMTTELLHNLDRAQRIREGFENAEKELCLVGNGAAYGVGKTSITEVIYDCLRELFTPHGYTVVHCYLDGYESSTPYQKWIALCLDADALKGMRSKIDPRMTIAELLQTTEDYLAANNLIILLHMDEFYPFNQDGTTEETQKAFRACWEEMLMPILRTPRICLYISGRMAYFDSIARERDLPCRVLSAQLELLSRADIRKAFHKMAIPRPVSVENIIGSSTSTSIGDSAQTHTQTRACADGSTSTAGGMSTIPLSAALNHVLAAAAGGRAGSTDIAARVHELTGGVPRSVAEAMHALLSDPTFSTALFDQNSTAISKKLLDRLFSKRGDVYEAANDAAFLHFRIVTRVLKINGGAAATHLRFVGLLQLILLPGRTIQLTEDYVRHQRVGGADNPAPSAVQRLLWEAQFWGIHHDLNVRAKALKFQISPLILAGLSPHMVQFLDYHGVAGASARAEVKRALLFHRVLANSIRHPNWLGLSEDPPARAPAVEPQAGTIPAEDLLWLPCLPAVTHPGLITTVEELEEIVYGRPKADKRPCPPMIVDEILSSRSKDGFHIVEIPTLRGDANFMVRYGDEVTHLHVRDSKALGFAEFRREIAKLVPIVQKAPELKHTLAYIVMNPTGRAEALRKLSVPRDALVQKLRKAAQAADVRNSKKPGKARAGKQTAGDANAFPRDERKYAHEAASLVEQGRIVVRVLDDAQVGRFFRHRELVETMLTTRSPFA